MKLALDEGRLDDNYEGYIRDVPLVVVPRSPDVLRAVVLRSPGDNRDTQLRLASVSWM